MEDAFTSAWLIIWLILVVYAGFKIGGSLKGMALAVLFFYLIPILIMSFVDGFSLKEFFSYWGHEWRNWVPWK